MGTPVVDHVEDPKKRKIGAFVTLIAAALAGTAAALGNLETVEKFLQRFISTPEEQMHGRNVVLLHKASTNLAAVTSLDTSIPRQMWFAGGGIRSCIPNEKSFRTTTFGKVSLLQDDECAVLVEGEKIIMVRVEPSNVRIIPVKDSQVLGIFEIYAPYATGTGLAMNSVLIIPVTADGVKFPLELISLEGDYQFERYAYEFRAANSYKTTDSSLMLNRTITLLKGNMNPEECPEDGPVCPMLIVERSIKLPTQRFEWNPDGGFQQTDGNLLTWGDERTQEHSLREIYNKYLGSISDPKQQVVPVLELIDGPK